MDVPGIVEEALDGEEVAAGVDLGGDDAVFVTPTRTLIYRSEGLLSDESVESYSHDAESLSFSKGRRKTRITLEHPVEGTEEYTLPSSAADEAIPAILAGVLRANDVITDGESVVDTYLFSELTLVISDDRLVKHVGETVWDMEFEEYPFADVTAVYAEKGSVATQLIIEVDGRAERIKTPSDRSREVRETLEDALRRHHGLRPEEDLNDALAPADPDPDAADAEETDEAGSPAGGMDFGEGVDPLSAGDTSDTGSNPDPSKLEQSGGDEPPAGPAASDAAPADAGDGGSGAIEAGSTQSRDAGSEQPGDRSSAGQSSEATGAAGGDPGAGAGGTDSRDGSTSAATADVPGEPDGDELQEAGFESAADRSEELTEEIAELRSAVQKQNKLLARQHKTIEKLVEELRRGR